MTKSLILLGMFLTACFAALYFQVSSPKVTEYENLAALTAEVDNGEKVFLASGCGSCHSDPQASPEQKRVLAGGQLFETPFGRFYAPNISTSRQNGIGNWNLGDFERAIRQGVSPDGAHYFPVFPYTAYQHMKDQDLVDLWAYWQSLPASEQASKNHDLPLPFGIRRNVGVWKWMFVEPGWAITGELSLMEEQGRYLVEALGHCGECHTPRNALGALQTTNWLAGAKNPTGNGRIPNITPAELTWSEEEISEYLYSGFTPEFDMVGGHMALVVENLAQLSQSDRDAIAQYLKKVPAIANQK